jgi:hypothetical protein
LQGKSQIKRPSPVRLEKERPAGRAFLPGVLRRENGRPALSADFNVNAGGTQLDGRIATAPTLLDHDIRLAHNAAVGRMTVPLDDNRTGVLGAPFTADRTNAVLPAHALRICGLDQGDRAQESSRKIDS